MKYTWRDSVQPLSEEYVRTAPGPTYYFTVDQGARVNGRHQLEGLLGNLDPLIGT